MTQNDDSRIDSRKTYKLKKALVVITVIVGLSLLILLASTTFRGRVLTCSHFVDNEAVAGGDGSLARPWNNIAGHVADLVPGDMMCIRGDPSAPGRVYTEDTINLVGCNSGTSSSPITVRPYQDEYVEIASTASGHGINVSGVDYWTFQDLHMDASNPTYMINILGDHNVIENCTLYDGEWGIRIYSGNHNTVRGCTIHNFDSGPYVDAHGIYLMKNTHDTTIESNAIYDIRGDCIQLGEGVISGTLIENNHLYTTLGRCSEQALDAKGGSPIVRGNVFHGFRRCDGSCGGTGGGIGGAIVVQMSAQGALIDSNEFYDCASGIRAEQGDQSNVVITGNLFHDFAIDDSAWLNSAIALIGSDSTRIDHNTFAHLPRHYLFIHTNSTDAVFTNNLLYDVNRNEIRQPVAADYNGWFDAAQTVPGPHDITGADPLLTANYRLTADSPARDAGEDDTDLGAFPYSEEIPTPTPTTSSPLPTPTTDSPLPTPTPAPTDTPSPIPSSTPSSTPTQTNTPTATPLPPTATPTITPTSDSHWYDDCPPDPPTRTPWPVQLTLTPRPTFTPRPTPTCRPTATQAPNPSPSPYPTQAPYLTGTPYPPQP